MMRRPRSLLAAATVLLPVALAQRASAAGWLLPAPPPGDVRAASVRSVATPATADGEFDVRTTLTLLNASEAPQDVLLAVPAGGRAAVAGEAVPLQPGGARLHLEAGEALIVEVTGRIEAGLESWLPEQRAGWHGRSRGPVLEPVQTLLVDLSPGGVLGCPITLSLKLPEHTLASAIFASPPPDFDGQLLEWSLDAGAPALPTVAWPVLDDDALVPRTLAEAQGFVSAWEGGGLDAAEIARVKDAVLASGAPERARAAEVLSVFQASRPRHAGGPSAAPGPPPPAAASPPATRVPTTPEPTQPSPPEAPAKPAVAVAPTPREVAPPSTAPPSNPSAQAPVTAPPQREPAPKAELPPPEAPKPERAPTTPAVAPSGSGPTEPARAAPPRVTEPPSPAPTATTPNPAPPAPFAEPHEAAPPKPTTPQVPTPPAKRPPETSTKPPATSATPAPPAAAPPAVSLPASPPATPVPMVSPAPWIHDAAQARVFVAMERDAGTLSRERVAEALATIRARHGDPFDDDPKWREHFASTTTWYQPQDGQTPLQPREKEAVAVLKSAASSPAQAASPRATRPEPVAAAAPPTPPVQLRAPEPKRVEPTTSPAQPIAEGREPPSTDDVPWIRTAPEARVFLARERAAGFSADRVRAAIAVLRAHHGETFATEPEWRDYFASSAAWYEPRERPTPLGADEREALGLLQQALASAANFSPR